MRPRPTKPILAVGAAMSGASFDRREVVVAELDVGGADDRGDLVRPPELLDVEVRDADAPDEALLPELRERRPTLLDVLVGDRPVDLVEVDRGDAEPPQARLGLAQDRVAPQAVQHRASRPPDE